MKRLVIYFHYDAQGLLDGPCRFAVQALVPCADVVLVTNGSLRQQDRDWLNGEQIRYIERENVGLDVGAYREALLTLGREAVSAYEELVLMNYTLAGPVSPLQKMFSAMKTRADLDFWGLTRHYAMNSRRFGGKVPEHIQSHFLAVRAGMLQSDAFWTYWQEMQLPKSYEESIIRHETRFTAYFAAQGFAWDTYVQTEDLKPVFVNPIMACPRELIANRGCPFFKRRSFFTPYEDELRRTDGAAARELYDYLRRATDYPVDQLVGSMLRSQPLSVVAKNLHWHYVVDAVPQETGNLAEQGLRLVRVEPMQADTVTDWYLQQSVQQAETCLAQAAELFRNNPGLGVLFPALPLWPQAVDSAAAEWRRVRSALAEQAGVPMADDPPPAPLAGWALVRCEALAQELPLETMPHARWLLPLLAQKNGYYSATFETAAQAAARADYWQTCVRAANEPAAVAKQLGRLVKHKLKR